MTEFGSGRPLPGAVVTLTHRRTCSKAETRNGEPQCVPTHPHPAEQLALRCTTGPDGRASFAVPDHDYEPSVAGRHAGGAARAVPAAANTMRPAPTTIRIAVPEPGYRLKRTHS